MKEKVGFLLSRENSAEPHSPCSLRVLCRGEGMRQTPGSFVGPSQTAPSSRQPGVSILWQTVPSSPNASRFVGTLLPEGLKMPEALLLGRRWITWIQARYQNNCAHTFAAENGDGSAPCLSWANGCAVLRSTWWYKLILKCCTLY